MATAPMYRVIEHLRRVVQCREGTERTDGQLLEHYIDQRDEAALEALVHRHGPMVLGVCRRVAGNVHDADDAFQATFLILVRKAASLSRRESVGNWLYGVAYRTALKAKTAAARRRRRERQFMRQHHPHHPHSPPEDCWRELQTLLDRELNRLPDKYRVPVVLCELEGRSRKEVARQLHLPEGTLSSRLATARRLLAGRLTRRGVQLSGAALALALSQAIASAEVPAALTATTLRAATLATPMLAPPVAALAEGVLRALALHRLKVFALLLLMAGAFATGLGVLTLSGTEARSTDEPLSFWTWAKENLREIEVIIPSDEFKKMAKGVPYTLHPVNANPRYQWKVRKGVTITRP